MNNDVVQFSVSIKIAYKNNHTNTSASNNTKANTMLRTQCACVKQYGSV